VYTRQIRGSAAFVRIHSPTLTLTTSVYGPLVQCFSKSGTRTPVGTRTVAWWHTKKFKISVSDNQILENSVALLKLF